VDNIYTKCISVLLDYHTGFDLITPEGQNSVKGLIQRVPNSFIKILDDAITMPENPIKAKNMDANFVQLFIDFRFLFGKIKRGNDKSTGPVKRPKQPDSTLLMLLLDIPDKTVRKEFLTHPVLHAYLDIKWRRIQLRYLFLRIIHVRIRYTESNMILRVRSCSAFIKLYFFVNSVHFGHCIHLFRTLVLPERMSLSFG